MPCFPNVSAILLSESGFWVFSAPMSCLMMALMAVAEASPPISVAMTSTCQLNFDAVAFFSAKLLELLKLAIRKGNTTRAASRGLNQYFLETYVSATGLGIKGHE